MRIGGSQSQGMRKRRHKCCGFCGGPTTCSSSGMALNVSERQVNSGPPNTCHFWNTVKIMLHKVCTCELHMQRTGADRDFEIFHSLKQDHRVVVGWCRQISLTKFHECQSS